MTKVYRLPPNKVDWSELDRDLSALIRQVEIDRAVRRRLRRRRLKERVGQALWLAWGLGFVGSLVWLASRIWG